jgi:endogenous inhibitor of DNA gyrase (YacG/DUF329 family)
MNVIWIVCPTTGKEVSTGIKMDAANFASLPAHTLALVCPECGKTHIWGERLRGHMVEAPSRYSN